MLCTVIQEETSEKVLDAISEAKEYGSDLVEIRIDHIKEPNLKLILQRKSLPAIITVRPLWEGGNYKGNEDSRMSLLREAVSLGAEYIDMEFKAYKDLNKRGTKLILSYHDFTSVPRNIASILDKMKQLTPDIIKIAVTPNSITDVLNLAVLQRSASTPTAILPMGELGMPSRILYKRLGGALTYTALAKDKKTAPGQPVLKELIELYRVREINDDTVVYAIIANPVSHSKSPLVFNSAFKQERVNAVYVPILIDDISKLRDIIGTFRIAGLSVTIPHKSAVIKYLDEIDDASRIVGAVNTIIVRNGKLVGYNTDITAVDIIAEVARGIFNSDLKGKKVLVIGAGGVARPIVYGLTKRGAKVTIVNRTFERAKTLADEFACTTVRISEAGNISADIVVNATSAGMYPNDSESPISRGVFRKGMIVLDCVYTPKETKFLKDAKDAVAAIIYGTDMFTRQASVQYEYFTGKNPGQQILDEWDELLSVNP